MNMEKNGWLLLWTAISNEIASSDEAYTQRYFLFFIKSTFHFSCQTVLSHKISLCFPIMPFRRMKQLLGCWLCCSYDHERKRKYFAELELGLPFKYTCWNLCKNPVSLDFAEHSGTQRIAGNHGKVRLAESRACSFCGNTKFCCCAQYACI